MELGVGLIREGMAVVVGVAVPIGVVAATGDGLSTAAGVTQLLADVTVAAAGVALLASWRITGRALTAWLGMAFVALGLLSLARSRLAGSSPGSSGAAADPYGLLVCCGVAAVAVLAALRSAEVDAGIAPLRLLGVAVPAGLVALGLLDLPGARHPASAATVAVIRAFCTLIWWGLAAGAWRMARAHRRRAPGWVAAVLLVLGLVPALATATPGTTWGEAVPATALLTAAALALASASRELRWSICAQQRHALDLRAAKVELEHELGRERSELDALLHALRNSVAGVCLADTTLRRHAGQLSPDTEARVTQARSAELARLRALVDVDPVHRGDPTAAPIPGGDPLGRSTGWASDGVEQPTQAPVSGA